VGQVTGLASPAAKREAPRAAAAPLCVCIVNYRTPQLVIDCLASFLGSLGRGHQVVVADSCSGDASMEKIGNWLSANDAAGRCKLVALPANNGFSAGYNAAMKECAADLYLLLNSDTALRGGAIDSLMDAATRHPEAGIVSPRLEWPDGTPQESCFRDHSPIGELIGAARTRHISGLFRKSIVALPVADHEVRPEWTSFAAVLVRREALETAGMLDEGFFLYFEDCEFCYRARRAGWAIVHVPQARVVHLRGGSSEVKARGAAAERLPRYYYESRARYFRLRYGLAGPTLANLCWHAGRSISFVRERFAGKENHLPESMWKDIWANWRSPLSGNRRRQ
jgi:N-acetylglucosaminyl-diphospho-decaprenol L-rhamnosyltransferase